MRVPRGFLYVLGLFLASTGFSHNFEGKRVSFTEPEHLSKNSKEKSRFVALKVRFSVDCDEKKANAFPGITGSVALKDHTVRFELYDAAHSTTFGLGAVEGRLENLPIQLDASDHCSLVSLAVENAHTDLSKLNETDRLGILHAPFIASRPNQIPNRLTDLPLGTGYSRVLYKGRDQKFTIKSTAVFSDEDTMKTKEDTDFQLGRYGRRSDIEWVSEIEFKDKSREMTRERYHCPVIGTVGHSTCEFKGKYLPNTKTPILYNFTDNNVFSDTPKSDDQGLHPVGHHYLPPANGGYLPFPVARESLQFQNPWMFRVSDFEMRRENKFTQPYTDYLYVLIDGVRNSGSLQGLVEFASGAEMLGGGGRGTIDRLGEDLWNRQAYTAIPVNTTDLPRRLRQLGERNPDRDHRGDFKFRGNGDFDISSLSFYRFRRAECDPRGVCHWPEDISEIFDCGEYRKKDTVCAFPAAR